MADTRVLEWVRDPAGVWNLPASAIGELAREFPDVRFDTPGSREEAETLLPGADVVLGYVVRPHNLARAGRLRWIHSPAAGVASYLFPELIESDVVLTNGRGIHARSMTEHALGVMLAFTRRLHVSRDAQLARRWATAEQWRARLSYETLEGATLGLVGLGRIGAEIATAARALGMRVIAVRRRPAVDAAPADEQWPAERLGELLERADWLVLVAPLTPGTRHLIGRAELARMKPGARLVNLARGALVDEPALVAALDEGRLAGAALDVFESEPLPADSPLWAHPEVILTPHTGGAGPRYWERTCRLFGDNLRRYLDGRPLENVVDKRAGY